MKIKFGEVPAIFDIYNSKIKLSNGNVFSLEAAFRFTKIIRELDEIRAFYSERINQVIQSYGEKDEFGNFVFTDESRQTIKIQEEHIQDANKEIEEISKVEVDIKSEPLHIKDFEYIKNMLTIDELYKLSTIIED